jgi:K+-sensing histidine kinase KdpD
MSYIALGVGMIVIPGLFALTGRLIGFSVMVLWSAATAYFLMPPAYSFRISNPGDLAAIALYGAAGLVFASTAPRARRAVRNEPEIRETDSPRDGLVNLAIVLADLMSSSGLGQRLRERGVEIKASRLHDVHCSYADAVRILSDVLGAAVTEPGLRMVSLHVGRRPEADLVFVDAHSAWPPPVRRTIIIGKRDDDSSRIDFNGWPAHLSATWFDNGYGRSYLISLLPRC